VLKLGVAGYEGHGQAFTEALNGTELGDKLGMKVAVIWQDPDNKKSHENMLSASDKLGFQVAHTLKELEEGNDGIIIGEERPTRYLELAKPFMQKKLPTFINRPVGASVGDAGAIFHMAKNYRTPILTGSSLVFDPVVRNLITEVEAFKPIQLFYDTGPTNFVNFYLPHVISVAVTVFGAGVLQVRCLALEWDEPGWTCKGSIIASVEYSDKAKYPGLHGIIAQVPDPVKNWYGFRLKVFGAGESQEYNTYQSHGWQEILEAFKQVIETKKPVIPEEEAMEVPKIYYAILRSASERRPIQLSEFDDEIKDRIWML